MALTDRLYVFIDEGIHADDEPVAVGPFASEDEARREGDDRPVRELWTMALWRAQTPVHVGHVSRIGGTWWCDTCNSPYCDLA